MINTIVFDIGQVLAEFRWEAYLKECGYSEETCLKVSNATILSKVWGEVDRGSHTESELITLCCEQDPSVSKEITTLFQNFNELIREYTYSEQLVQQLKENGYRIYLLSNFGFSYEKISKNFKFIPYIDGGVISYEVNHIKPEPKIYEILIEKYNINPEEAVFLDDLQANLDGASRFGFNTIQVKSYDSTLMALRELGIKI